MSKHIESQRTEAYRIYMSDSLAFLNISLTGNEYPRYIDLVSTDKKPTETTEEIISRFNPIVRKNE